MKEYNKIAREKFAIWLSLPPKYRVPKSQGELANELGVAEETLSRFKKEEGFWNLTKKYTNRFFRERVSDVLHGLYRKARVEGTSAEVKLFLDIVGYHQVVDKLDIKTDINEFDNLTVEEKRKMNELIKKAENGSQTEVKTATEPL